MPLRPKSLHRSNASPKNITRAAAVVHIAERSVSRMTIDGWRCVLARGLLLLCTSLGGSP